MRACRAVLCLSFLFILSSLAFAFQPKTDKNGPNSLSSKEFFLPELYISSTTVSFNEISKQLHNEPAWNNFLSQHPGFQVYFDPRSGIPVNIIGHFPMIPGTGVDNRVSLSDLSAQLGRPVSEVTPEAVSALFLQFVTRNRDLIGIDLHQLGEVHATKVNSYLWNLWIGQQVNGVPVRWARFAGTINHGNLIMTGAENWGNVAISALPAISAAQALSRGFQYLGGQTAADSFWKQPFLEIIPTAPQSGTFNGPVGSGYSHRLAWTFGFTRSPGLSKWQMSVDAATGEVLELKDTNDYVDARFIGGIYPLTDTEICPTPDTCGAMVTGEPIPFANTGLPAPNDFTNSAGLFNFTSGTVNTTFTGKYVHMSDDCGPINVAGTPGIDFGGVNGQHDCTLPVPGGVTSAARSGMYELNKIFEEARGYLPANAWLNGQQPTPLPSNMNIALTCNAFYSPGDPGSVNFYKSGGGCRNTGEIAAVFDHEWGHGMDDHDGNGLSNSSEGYADIASMYRLWASCVGFGFFNPGNQSGCGDTADGTGSNNDEAQQGPSHCDTDCSGVRDADWAKHADGLPDTVAFTCASCFSGGGPCGTQVHCSATTVRQAAWDLVARDLQTAPFNYDPNTAFIIGDRVFYLGSGNVGNWHSCSCPSTSDGCGATNGYMGWIGADDDNGTITDGTPHMTAIHAAYNRHGIACASPAPTNSGCSGGPTTAPVVTAIPGNNSVTLTWPAVANAVSYNVFRTEGYATCNFGKVLVGNTATTQFTDSQVVNDRDYGYVVMAVGTDDSCFTPASSCVITAPQPCVGSVTVNQATYSCSSTININMGDGDLAGAGTHNVTVFSDTETTPETVSLTETPPNSGLFTGTFDTTSAPPANGDGHLSVADGDTITVRYHDDSYCGPPQDVDTTAIADCVAPAISNVQIGNIGVDTATVTWNTNETANARTTHAVAPGPPSINTDNLGTFDTSHSITINALTGCTDYVVSATSFDPAGNAMTDNNGGAFYQFTTFGEGFLVSDDVESGQSDWVVAGRGNSDFHVDTCQFNSPIHAWKAGSTLCPGTYNNSVLTALTSAAPIDITIGSRLRFAERYKTAAGDFCRIQRSTDNGMTWVTMDTYSGDNGAWSQKIYDLSAFAGMSMKLRFLFSTNAAGSSEGWYIDDIRVTRSISCGVSFHNKLPLAADGCSQGGVGDNNGVLDPGETAAVQVTAQNFGSVTATGVTGHLTTSTPGVTIVGADATFPDIPSGGSGKSEAPFFQISVANSVPCGTAIQFQVDYTSDQGSASAPFSLVVGTPTSATTNYNATDVPKPIPAQGFVTSVINIPDTNIVENVKVTINVLHQNDGELDIQLGSPNPTFVDLSTGNGGSGANYSNTQFDDSALVSITAGSAPFTGPYHPEGNLSDVNGQSAAGNWTLNINDTTPGTAGTLSSWFIRVQTATGSTCNVCGAACPTITLSPATLPNGTLGGAYNQTITASGGTAPYTFSVTAGALPDGVTLASDGTLSGTTTVGGTFNFTIRATDNAGCSGTQDYTVNVGTCVFCDEFDDNTVNPAWSYNHITNWSEAGTLLSVNAPKKSFAIATVFAGCAACSTSTTISTTDDSSKVSFYGQYNDKKHAMEALFKFGGNKIVLKQRNGSVVKKQAIAFTLDPNTTYTVTMTNDGTNVVLNINGTDVATFATVGSLPPGTTGFQAVGNATFDYIHVN